MSRLCQILALNMVINYSIMNMLVCVELTIRVHICNLLIMYLCMCVSYTMIMKCKWYHWYGRLGLDEYMIIWRKYVSKMVDFLKVNNVWIARLGLWMHLQGERDHGYKLDYLMCYTWWWMKLAWIRISKIANASLMHANSYLTKVKQPFGL